MKYTASFKQVVKNIEQGRKEISSGRNRCVVVLNLNFFLFFTKKMFNGECKRMRRKYIERH